MTIIYQDKTYEVDFNRVKFSQVLKFQAQLKSGMTAKLNNETNETTMEITEQYALKEGSVITELIKIVFAIDFDLDELDTETGMDAYQFIQESPFFMRLSATKKKN